MPDFDDLPEFRTSTRRTTNKSSKKREPYEHELRPFVTLITDGSCIGNPGRGGWACILETTRYLNTNGQVIPKIYSKVITGSEENTTSNRMELMALIKGLQELKEPCQVTVICDARYVIDGFTQYLAKWLNNHWRTSRKDEVANKDLWKELLQVSKPHTLTFQWVKSHAAHHGNNAVDELARRVAYNIQHKPTF